MGGAEAIRYISRHGSNRISKLVLLGAAAPRLLKTPAFEEGVEKSVFDGMIENAIEDRAAFMESFSKDFLRGHHYQFSFEQQAYGLVSRPDNEVLVPCFY